MRTGGTPRTMSVRGLMSAASVMFGAGVPKKDVIAMRARRALARVLSRRMSMSFVARGRAWNPTAYPPTTRYLTRFAFKHAMNSAKSGNIKLSLQSKTVEHALADDFDALVSRHAAPRVEGLVLVEARHRDRPPAPRTVFDVAYTALGIRPFPRGHRRSRS